jgi:hypothetical protein
MREIKNLWQSIQEIEKIMGDCDDYFEAKARQKAAKFIDLKQDCDEEFFSFAAAVLQLRYPEWSRARCKELTECVIEMYSQWFDKFYGRLMLSPLLMVCRFFDNFCGTLSHQANMIVFKRMGASSEATGSLWDGEAVGLPEKLTVNRCPHCNQTGGTSDFSTIIVEGSRQSQRLPVSDALLNHFNAGIDPSVRRRVCKQSIHENDPGESI